MMIHVKWCSFISKSKYDCQFGKKRAIPAKLLSSNFCVITKVFTFCKFDCRLGKPTMANQWTRVTGGQRRGTWWPCWPGSRRWSGSSSRWAPSSGWRSPPSRWQSGWGTRWGHKWRSKHHLLAGLLPLYCPGIRWRMGLTPNCWCLKCWKMFVLEKPQTPYMHSALRAVLYWVPT